MILIISLASSLVHMCIELIKSFPNNYSNCPHPKNSRQDEFLLSRAIEWKQIEIVLALVHIHNVTMFKIDMEAAT